jgi:CDP-diacylglycerol--glycerol-3-phosphate 3-phosphatidyltransferase/CDP-diacylglycerol--serine O-phosphatidyltransferase
MSQNTKHLANLITFSRIIGVGFILTKMPFTTNFWQLWVIIIYTLIAFTDLLDGWVARRYNIVTDLGKILDPLADKILILAFLPLLSMQAISAFPVFIILSREFAIMGLRVFAAKQGIIIAAGSSGKFKTGITLPVVGILMGRMAVEQVAIPIGLTPLNKLVQWVYSWPSWCFESLIWTMVAITIWSFFDYFFSFLWQNALKNNNGDREKSKKTLLAFIPNFITFTNLFCGVFAIFYSMTGSPIIASGLVLLGIVLDACDGSLARKLGTFSPLGAKLDSKADLITFGVAPAFVIFQILSDYSINYAYPVAIAIALFFYGCVHFRLKRFDKGGSSDIFEGLPSPAGAGLVIIAMNSSQFAGGLWVYPIVIASAILMASTIAYPHNRVAHKKMTFRYVRPLSLVFWVFAIIQLLGLTWLKQFHIMEILFWLVCIYVAAPIVPLKKEFR